VSQNVFDRAHRVPALPGLSQRGITLVEMMVAMVVGLILLVGIVQLFISNKQAYRLQEATNVLNESGRYVLNQMHYDLRMADHWGGAERDTLEIMSGIDTIAGDCDGPAAALDTSGIFGIDGDAASPLDCIPDSDYVPESDIVIIRYAEPVRRASGALDDNRVYVRSAMGRRAVVFQGAHIATLPGDIAPADPEALHVEDETPDVANFEMRTVIYFLRPCASQDLGTANVCDAADDNLPTLTRLTLEGTSLVQQDVTAGVEQMQLAYGVDTNGDRSPEFYQSAEAVTAANNWPRVVDVKLSLLIRNTEIDVSYTDTTTYQLYGGADGAAVEYEVPTIAQQYRRKMYNSSIQVRNMTRG
jgi:type IV pilus assembly protein PilW